MTSTIDAGTTQCPRCDADLAFTLGADASGGLRYDVSCAPCRAVYFHMSTALPQHVAIAA